MIIEKDRLQEGINKISDELLIIKAEDSFWAIENKCPHYGVPLEKSDIIGKGIKCHEHGIIFSFETGENINREFEECDRLKFFKIEVYKSKLIVEQ